jgi:phage baseplate assembly protein W
MPLTSSIDTSTSPSTGFSGFGQMSDLGSNWRIKFADADGIPLNMLSFEQIDFGAISYKEIFQNVKTILATPKYSAALERLLGVNQTIVDLPIDQAAQATVAILDALYFWEPRAEPVNIQFEPDVLAGHLRVNLQLKIRNVIFGTDTPYDKTNIYPAPTPLPPWEPPTVNGDGKVIVGPPGPAGPRGSVWFVLTTDPTPSNPPPAPPPIGAPRVNDMCLNSTTGDVFQYQLPPVSPTSATSGLIWRRVMKQ